MLQIKRVGHSTLTTPDLERMVDYFIDIGEAIAFQDPKGTTLGYAEHTPYDSERRLEETP
jgi:hypothetical protein